MKKKIVIVTHFRSDDPECVSDYDYVTIEVDGKEVIRYGDSYHEKGKEKADGFVDALQFVYEKKNVKVSEENRADADSWY